MPLSAPNTSRKALHRRSITLDVYELADGLFEIEAHLTDVKPFEVALSQGIRPAGEPVHDMWLRLRFNSSFDVLACESVSDKVPYTGYCEAINPDYGKLVGTNLLKHFRQAIKDRLATTAGCTHLSELAGVLPTAAVQAMAGKMRRANPEKRPFQLDRCHALALDAPAVAQYYPQWYRNPNSTNNPASSAQPNPS
jgi:Protein of unknown function (DUF2889)